MLVLQTVLPALMLADQPSRLKLSGGTHNPMAPSYHFIERSFAPLLARMGVRLELALRRHGFYPAGGGEVEAEIHPAQPGLQPWSLLHRGEHTASFAECLAPALPSRVARRELEVVGRALGWSDDQLRTPVTRQNEGPGNALMATLAHEHVTEVFTRFGEKGVSAERVANQLVADVSTYLAHTAAVGPYLADQLALPLALAVHQSGRSASYTCHEVTEHTRTNFDVIRRFLPIDASILRQDGHWLIELKPGAR
jgi:RNA 3'-terminal phosphate cyclase (ATP)